jgi:hypothetical protein
LATLTTRYVCIYIYIHRLIHTYILAETVELIGDADNTVCMHIYIHT